MFLRASLATLILSVMTAGAHATAITDPVGDFIPSFTGLKGPDLDVVFTSGFLLSDHFAFSATLNGAVGQTPGSFYVFGVDRGKGTARFGSIAPGVLFDSVVVVTPNRSSVVRDLIAGTTMTLATSSTTISGNSLEVDVSSALLPTQGFDPGAYTFNLWPRTSTPASGTTPVTGTAQISDFAPNDRNLSVAATSVPEPASWAILGMAGLGMLGLRRRSNHVGANGLATAPVTSSKH